MIVLFILLWLLALARFAHSDEPKLVKPDNTFPYVVAQFVPTPPRIALEERYEANPRQALGLLCSCVNYAKWILGVSLSESWGNAWNIEPTHQEPQVGDLIITNEGRGHVGIVISFDNDSVSFIEANYYRCRKSQRELELSSASILGYRSVNSL